MPRRLVLLAFLTVASVLLAGCGEPDESDPDADDDGDGLSNRNEREGWTATITLASGPSTRRFDSDPQKRDTDGDGLEDYDESVRGTDPRSVDSDADGLLDGESIVLEPDSERAAELRRAGVLESPRGTFLGELAQCEPAGLKGSAFSSDRPQPDGLGDGEELTSWTIFVRGEPRTVRSDPCVPDTDSDGLLDHDEKALGVDPTVADTDGDGARDGSDADPAADLGVSVSNFTVESDASARLTFALGTYSRDFAAPFPERLDVDVPDAAATRDSLLAIGVVGATRNGTDEPLHLFPGGASATLRFDLAAGTLTIGGEAHREGRVALQGEDGGVTFDWAVTRQ